MINDPEKWTEQRWVIPRNMLQLVRKEEDWFIEYQGLRFTLSDNYNVAWKLANAIASQQLEESWIDRHSLQFRWLRFWYRRKKRREARHAKGLN
jgi:hypothetical protein